jgi:hypothetical protein
MVDHGRSSEDLLLLVYLLTGDIETNESPSLSYRSEPCEYFLYTYVIDEIENDSSDFRLGSMHRFGYVTHRSTFYG